MATNRTLLVIGSGPGIGRSVTTLFASKRYDNVALISRRAAQLEIEKSAVEQVLGSNIHVKTFAVDVANTDELLGALTEAESQLGKAECVFYNAARVLPSELLDHDLKEIEYDLRINVLALYAISQRKIPDLLEMAEADPTSLPSLIVTSSCLAPEPVPEFFALSLVKAAQRNLMQSLAMTYASRGVHIGLINVGGPVSPEHGVLNPPNIAAQAWEWFARSKEEPSFEVKI